MRDSETLNAVSFIAAVDNKHCHFVECKLVKECIPESFILGNILQGYGFAVLDTHFRCLAFGHGLGSFINIDEIIVFIQVAKLGISAANIRS